MKTLASLIALALFAAAADARPACNGPSCSTQTQTVIVQTVQVAPAPAPVASGCNGGSYQAGGCAGNQGSGCAGGSGGPGRRGLFSGGGLRHRSDSGGGLLARHRNRGASSTTAVVVQQWDDAPQAPAAAPAPKATPKE